MLMGEVSASCRGGCWDSLDLCSRQADFLLLLSVRIGLLQRECIDVEVVTQLVDLDRHIETERETKRERFDKS